MLLARAQRVQDRCQPLAALSAQGDLEGQYLMGAKLRALQHPVSSHVEQRFGKQLRERRGRTYGGPGQAGGPCLWYCLSWMLLGSRGRIGKFLGNQVSEQHSGGLAALGPRHSITPGGTDRRTDRAGSETSWPGGAIGADHTGTPSGGVARVALPRARCRMVSVS